jgi:hypothetical protein
MRSAVEALPGYDPSHEQGHVLFRFESEIADRSLAACDICVPEMPQDRIRYVYNVHMFHIKGSVIAICSRREIAWLIRNEFLQACRLGTVELDIDALSHEHSGNVERLHCRLENNPELSDVTLGGPDVMRSDLFRELGSATYVSVSLRAKFDRKGDEDVVTCNADGSPGTLLSSGLKGAFSFDTEASVTCTRSGTASIEPSVPQQNVLTFGREVLKYERRSSNWQS